MRIKKDSSVSTTPLTTDYQCKKFTNYLVFLINLYFFVRPHSQLSYNTCQDPIFANNISIRKARRIISSLGVSFLLHSLVYMFLVHIEALCTVMKIMITRNGFCPNQYLVHSFHFYQVVFCASTALCHGHIFPFICGLSLDILCFLCFCRE